MKIFVTGAGGYIGNRLVHMLANQGNQVYAFIRPTSFENTFSHPLIKIFKGALADKRSIAMAMNDCTQVYHTASGCKLWTKKKKNFYEQNIGNTINVLDAAVECGVDKVVYTSCCSSWSPANNHMHTENDPRIASFDNDYDLSKHLAEKTVKEYGKKGLSAVIVNPSHIYGPGSGIKSNGVNRFINVLLGGIVSPLPWHLDVKANYTFIDDVVNGHILAMEKGSEGERYILGGENISYREIIQAIKDNYSRTKLFVRTPGFVFNAWGVTELIRARFTEYEPILTPALTKRFLIAQTFDCTKAIAQLGYRITPFSTGIKTTIDYLIQQSRKKWIPTL